MLVNRGRRLLRLAELEATQVVSKAKRERDNRLKDIALSAQDQSHKKRTGVERKLASKRRKQLRFSANLRQRQQGVQRKREALVTRREALATRNSLAGGERPAGEAGGDVWAKNRAKWLTRLEALASEKAQDVRARLAKEELENLAATASQELRRLDQGANDREVVRRSKRLLGMSVARYYGHYLIERHHSVISLMPSERARGWAPWAA